MDDLLTTRQVLELLQVDRTTIYRMLNDGRLIGVKIGNQWRFHREKVEELISGAGSMSDDVGAKAADILPIHCLQPIQDVFAEIANVGSLTTESNGEPVTELSHSCTFCNLILSSENGRKGCISSWEKLASLKEKDPQFLTCHAGLQYLGARIDLDGELLAVIFAGQVYADAPDTQVEKTRINHLAKEYGIDEELLIKASKELRVLDDRHRDQLGKWLAKVANTFERIGKERAELIQRLRKISDLSSVMSD